MLSTYYAHLGTISVAKNSKVNTNSIIGTVGDTGNAKGTAPHLHFEVTMNGKKVNPAQFFSIPTYSSKLKNNESLWLSNDAKAKARSFKLPSTL